MTDNVGVWLFHGLFLCLQSPQIAVRGQAGCEYYAVDILMFFPAFSLPVLGIKPKFLDGFTQMGKPTELSDLRKDGMILGEYIRFFLNQPPDPFNHVQSYGQSQFPKCQPAASRQI
jgi:hypothetical protein